MGDEAANAVKSFREYLLGCGFKQTASDRYEDRTLLPFAVEIGTSHMEVTVRFSETTPPGGEGGSRNVRPVPGHEIRRYNMLLNPSELLDRFKHDLNAAKRWVESAMVTRAKRRAEANGAGAVD